MKRLLSVVFVVALAMALSACGDDSSSAEPEPAKLTKPQIEPPKTPPTELIVNDIEEGSGPEAEYGDKLTIHYLGVDENGIERYTSWGFDPITYDLGSGAFFEAWDEGVKGMKVGGRRELLFPSNLTFGGTPLYYVVDLLKIE